MARQREPRPTNLQEAAAQPGVGTLLRKFILQDKDPRFQELHRKETYYRGTQYLDRPYDWNGQLVNSPFESGGYTAPVGLVGANGPTTAQCQPSAQYNLGRVVINRFVALLCGEKRFPHFRVPRSQQSEDYLNALARACYMRAVTSEAAGLGGAIGSVIMLFTIVPSDDDSGGRFRLECFNTKHCIIDDWKDFHAGEMRSFAVTYPYCVQEYDPTLKAFANKWYFYKRIITEHADMVCEPIPAVKLANGAIHLADEKCVPRIDEDASTFHDLGFVPAQFIQNLPRYDEIDGDSTLEGAYALLDRISELYSAVHQGTIGNLDPTLLLNITPEDYGKLLEKGGIIQLGTGKNGVAVVVGEKGGGKYLEIDGAGMKLALEVADEFKECVLDTTDCVIPDPERITGVAQSAAAISKLYESMLAKCDVLRSQYGERGLKALVVKMVIAYFMKRTVARFAPLMGVDAATGQPKEFTPDEQLTADDILLVWGDYFSPTAADALQAVQAASIALGNKAVTSTEVATKYAAPYINDPDVVRTVADVNRERDEDHAREVSLLQEQAKLKPTAPKPGKKPAA